MWHISGTGEVRKGFQWRGHLKRIFKKWDTGCGLDWSGSG